VDLPTPMDADLKRWQSRMAPFMFTAVVVTALFFSVASIWKFGHIEASLMRPSMDCAPAPWNATGVPPDFDQHMRLAAAQASYKLECELINRRYEQANLAFESRLWTRFMGFITGMILALVGAVFVLGKLETDRSEVEAAAKGVSLAVRSTSPGILLAVLGAVLMGLSIALPVTVSVTDGAIYFARQATVANEEPPPTTSAAPSNKAEPQPRRPP
jgi:hypothetical protein